MKLEVTVTEVRDTGSPNYRLISATADVPVMGSTVKALVLIPLHQTDYQLASGDADSWPPRVGDKYTAELGIDQVKRG